MTTKNDRLRRPIAILKASFLWALMIIYIVLPTTILVLFREPEITATLQFGRNLAWAKASFAVTVILSWKFGRRAIGPCLALALGTLKYQMDACLWRPPADTNLAGKVAVVTGANGGMGLTTAKKLAAMGAHVVLTCRSVEKCQGPVEEVQAAGQASGGSAGSAILDLGSLKSASNLADQLISEYPSIHFLFNNAGTTPRHRVTSEGLEDGFGAMHLGHMSFTLGLLPSLVNAGKMSGSPSRVIMTSSEMGMSAACGHFGEVFYSTFFKGTGEGDLRGEITHGDGTTWMSLAAYGRAKLCNMLFAFEANRRMADKQLPVILYALHTGAVGTPSAKEGVGGLFDGIPFLPFVTSNILLPLLWRSPDEGASTLLFAALANDPPEMTKGGLYINALCRPTILENVPITSSKDVIPVRFGNTTLHLYNSRRKALRDADERWSARLWNVSTQLLEKYGDTRPLLL